MAADAAAAGGKKAESLWLPRESGLDLGSGAGATKGGVRVTKGACRIARPGRRTPRMRTRRDLRLWQPGGRLRQRTSTFSTRAAALSPAAQPVKRP